VTAARAALAVAVAGAIAALLYLSLDSGLAAPPAERLVSLPLGGLAAIFAASAWAASVGGYPQRVPFFAGLSIGIGLYSLVRVLAW
jgi:hypothetical protein